MTAPAFRPASPPPDRPPERPDESGSGRKRRADAGKPRGRRRSSAKLETRIGAFLAQTNMILLQIPAVRADALDPYELQLLAKGISDEADRHPALRRYIEAALDVSASGGLIMTVAIISARRAARHNVIPPNTLPIPNPALDAMLGQMLQMMSSGAPSVSAPPAIKPDAEMNGHGSGSPLD